MTKKCTRAFPPQKKKKTKSLKLLRPREMALLNTLSINSKTVKNFGLLTQNTFTRIYFGIYTI